MLFVRGSCSGSGVMIFAAASAMVVMRCDGVTGVIDAGLYAAALDMMVGLLRGSAEAWRPSVGIQAMQDSLREALQVGWINVQMIADKMFLEIGTGDDPGNFKVCGRRRSGIRGYINFEQLLFNHF